VNGPRAEVAMHTCPNCGLGEIREEFCPDCGVKLGAHQETTPATEDRELRWKPVYLAPDEVAGLSVAKILEAEGIDSRLQSLQVPGHEGLLRLIDGAWGRVLVFEDDEVRACTVIEGYLRNLGSGYH
jgi:hypothetical protein